MGSIGENGAGFDKDEDDGVYNAGADDFYLIFHLFFVPVRPFDPS